MSALSLFENETVELTASDVAMIAALADEIDLTVELGRLDRSPKKNWVEKAGGLPKYIEDIAVEIEKTGKTVSQAIAIAISRVRKLAATSKDAVVKSKAAKALAQWTALKAKNKAKSVVKASHRDGSSYDLLCLSAEFNLDTVRSAFDANERERRRAARLLSKDKGYDEYDLVPYRYVREVWSSFLIVENEGTRMGSGAVLAKIPFSVDESGAVTFGSEIPVKVEYVEIRENSTSDTELATLSAAGLSGEMAPLLKAARGLKTAQDAAV